MRADRRRPSFAARLKSAPHFFERKRSLLRPREPPTDFGDLLVRQADHLHVMVRQADHLHVIQLVQQGRPRRVLLVIRQQPGLLECLLQQLGHVGIISGRKDGSNAP